MPTPYPHNALSRLAGVANHARDAAWLAAAIPCQAQCPASTDIPAYLTAVYDGRHEDAYRINLRDNVFPSVLGRVCARPCESDCRHGRDDLGESVAICFSKRAAADLHGAVHPVVLDPVFPPSGKSVAVVGAGVAGLAAARNLALLGHSVTVYERHAAPGGMMVQGIPVFRLPRECVEREIAQIQALGVEIVCNTHVGRDVALSDLRERHDAVVLAAGTLRPNLLELPGSELAGIRHGLDFLLEVNSTGAAEVGRNVIVIGGGFTAMDCARTALRLGTQRAGTADWKVLPLTQSQTTVKVLYRRSVDEMLVTPGELDELQHEGIELQLFASPVAYVDDGRGHVKAVRFVRTELGEPGPDGRRRPVPVPGSEFDVDADLVLLATGQFPDTDWVGAALRPALVDADNWLSSGDSAVTRLPGVFAAGDFATGAKSLIDAIGHAKGCARRVDRFLVGEDRIEDVALIQDANATGRIREMDAVELQPMPCLTPDARSLEREVETGYPPSLAADETQRCYRCHYKYEIDPDKCIYCDWCVKAKPRPECIVKVRELQYADDGTVTGYVKATGSEDTKLIFINPRDCIRCNACVDACPADAISIQKVSATTRTRDGRCGLL